MDDSSHLMRTYPAPGAGFDPHTAPDYLLRRHGLPRRPDPDREPELSRLWTQAFAHELNFVEAELAVDPHRSGRTALWVPGGPSVPQGWSGAFRRQSPGSDFSDPATMVYAQWVIPEVLGVDPGDGDLQVGFWIGLDGADQMELLQAGVAAIVSPGLFSTSIEWYAWTEWYTALTDSPAQSVQNFPVGAGDEIAVMVCARQPTSGFVSLANLTRKIATSVVVPAPPGLHSYGATAEWIVEVPSGPALPTFEPITFTQCTAGSDTEVFHLQPDGLVVNMEGNSDGTPLTRSTILSPTSLQVQWKAFN